MDGDGQIPARDVLHVRLRGPATARVKNEDLRFWLRADVAHGG